MSKHNDLGRKGEQIACDFLTKKGHTILTTNFIFEHKEIDIISQYGDLIVFSEIKTRSSLQFGFPEEAVTIHKQNLIKKAAEGYLEKHPNTLKCRFDVISIVLKKDKALQIHHFEDAFY